MIKNNFLLLLGIPCTLSSISILKGIDIGSLLLRQIHYENAAGSMPSRSNAAFFPILTIEEIKQYIQHHNKIIDEWYDNHVNKDQKINRRQQKKYFLLKQALKRNIYTRYLYLPHEYSTFLLEHLQLEIPSPSLPSILQILNS